MDTASYFRGFSICATISDFNDARSYFLSAINYRDAANTIHATMETRSSQEAYGLIDPAYYLYAHAIELALKACLHCHGEKVPHGLPGHAIVEIYPECRTKGYLTADDMDSSVQSLTMLGQANEKYEYRYPERKASQPQIVLPALDWVKESAGKIFSWVEPQVAAWSAANPIQSGPIPIRLQLLKPVTTQDGTEPAFDLRAAVA